MVFNSNYLAQYALYSCLQYWHDQLLIGLNKLWDIDFEIFKCFWSFLTHSLIQNSLHTITPSGNCFQPQENLPKRKLVANSRGVKTSAWVREILPLKLNLFHKDDSGDQFESLQSHSSLKQVQSTRASSKQSHARS